MNFLNPDIEERQSTSKNQLNVIMNSYYNSNPKALTKQVSFLGVDCDQEIDEELSRLQSDCGSLRFSSESASASNY